MKYFITAVVLVFLVSCKEKKVEANKPNVSQHPTIDTIGINQQVSAENGKYELHTWVKTSEAEYCMHNAIYQSNYKYKNYAYDSHVIERTYDSIKFMIPIEYGFAVMFKEMADNRNLLLSRQSDSAKCLNKIIQNPTIGKIGVTSTETDTTVGIVVSPGKYVAKPYISEHHVTDTVYIHDTVTIERWLGEDGIHSNITLPTMVANFTPTDTTHKNKK